MVFTLRKEERRRVQRVEMNQKKEKRDLYVKTSG